MAATVYREGNVELLNGKVAVIGYGSQGHAHALNLRDSGVDVEVGLRLGSESWSTAEEAGLTVKAIPEAVQGARLVAILLPDHVQKGVFEREIEPNLEHGAAVLFAHGFNVHFGEIKAGPGHDVIMVAPKGPGHRVRQLFEAGAGTPGLVAVAQDASGNAFDLALAYGSAIGCGRAGMLATTFAEETESDLFGEQAVLCGGTTELVRAGFETLVAAGYQPEIAYYECLHELKLIVDLLWEGGLKHMRWSISDTAEFGDYVSGPRVIDSHVREQMQRVLDDIRSGEFAKLWISEMESGEAGLRGHREEAANQLLEQVGEELRSLMRREGASAVG